MHAPLTCKSACGPKAVHIRGVHCMIYRTVSLRMTLSEPWPRFQGHSSFKRQIFPKRCILQTPVFFSYGLLLLFSFSFYFIMTTKTKKFLVMKTCTFSFLFLVLVFSAVWSSTHPRSIYVKLHILSRLCSVQTWKDAVV